MMYVVLVICSTIGFKDCRPVVIADHLSIQPCMLISQPSAAEYLNQLPPHYRVEKMRCTDRQGMEQMLARGQA